MDKENSGIPTQGFRTSEAVFAEAAASFRNSLPGPEKEMLLLFDTPAAMLTLLKERLVKLEVYQNGSKLARLCKKIEEFASAWAPFFDIVGIFIQSNPEISALAWGAIRLVFLLGSNFTTFLEKIAAMFSTLADAMPGYAEYYDRVVKRWQKTAATQLQADALRVRQARLAKALSYVYADILQFCQEACKVFSTKRGGVRYKAAVIADLFWKPFDLRFASLLDRMRSHQSLFNRELLLEESKFMEMQFERRENDAEMTKEAMQQIQAQMHELRTGNQRTEEQLAAAFKNIDEKLEAMWRHPKASDEQKREADVLESRGSQIKTWIHAPEYMNVLEIARSKRAPDTCEWYLSSHQYCRWKSYDFSGTGSAPETISILTPMAAPNPVQPNPVLITAGKPGFGKTTLSSLVIEDLGIQPVTDGLSWESECVLFYHFASEEIGLCSPVHAWRSVLAQLIHGCRHNKDIIDAVSILYDENSVGQSIASGEEIMQCLRLLLPRFPRIVLLFDGIDECTDSMSFLEGLYSLCMETRTKSLLFSRPNVELPSSFRDASHFNISQAHNYHDIVTYLTPEIQCLQAKSWVRPDPPLKDIVERLTDKSAGMFLWAFLMVRYLNCRALSPKERHEAIFVSTLVEGIEGLYRTILSVIEKSYSVHHAVVQKIFYLVALAERPLSISELQLALAVQPGKVTDKDSLIPDFEESLPIICGSLVEVSEQGIVSFIHSSLHDFLTTQGTSCHPTFFVDAGFRHLDIASLCLSYLIFDTSRSPLNWPTRTAGSLSALQAIFPFLKYSLNWVRHVSQGLRLVTAAGIESSLVDSYTTLLSLMAKFMRERLSVTFWIEAAWTLGQAPTVDGLATRVSANDDPRLHQAMEMHPRFLPSLEHFTSDISRLQIEWGHLLTKSPAAIWTTSITAFIQSDFLYQTSEFQISSFAPSTTERASSEGGNESPSRSILLQSQVSESGQLLGVVVVTPSETYTDTVRRIFCRDSKNMSFRVSETQMRSFIKTASSGWKARYEQLSTQTETVIFKHEFELPRDDVCQLLSQSANSSNPDRFPFPVAMSADLNRLVVLRTLVTVHPVVRSQRLEPPQKMVPRDADRGVVVYSPTFAPDDNSIAFVTGNPSRNQIQSREIEVWSREDMLSPVRNEEASFIRRGSITASWLAIPQINQNDTSLGFAFHPSLPLIVFSEWVRISGWFFCHHGAEKTFTIVPAPGRPCGFEQTDLLTYTSWQNIQFDDGEHTDLNNSDDSHKGSRKPWNKLPSLDATVGEDYTADISCFLDAVLTQPGSNSNLKKPTPSSVITEHQDRAPGGWRLYRDQPKSAVVLKNNREVSQTGRGVNELVLAHLPQPKTREQTFVSLLKFAPTDEWIRLVWNKAAQESYSVHDTPNPYLPSIISRKRVLESEGAGDKVKRVRFD